MSGEDWETFPILPFIEKCLLSWYSNIKACTKPVVGRVQEIQKTEERK